MFADWLDAAHATDAPHEVDAPPLHSVLSSAMEGETPEQASLPALSSADIDIDNDVDGGASMRDVDEGCR